MWMRLAATLDLVHALLMAAQVVGIPLLFVHRWPRLTRAYAVYAVTFVTLSQGSQWLTGECFVTTWARWLWRRGAPDAMPPAEWLTVRMAQAVFHLSPSHRSVVLASEVVLVVTALGVLFTARRGHFGERISRLLGHRGELRAGDGASQPPRTSSRGA